MSAKRAAVGILLLAAIAMAFVYRQYIHYAEIEQGIARLGGLAPFAYIALYLIATILLLPGSILTLAAGVLFGPVLGALYALAGATVGATVAFLAARYLASGWVAQKAGGRLKQLIAGVEAEGWRFVAFVRLVPLFPYNILNYALGLTRIRLLDYVFASFVCMAPGAIAYAYLGYAGREALAGGEALIRKGLAALGLLALVAFLPGLIRRLRAVPGTTADGGWIEVPELAARLHRTNAPVVIDVRGPDEFTGDLGHIPAALNLPVGELRTRLTEVNVHKDDALILVCRTDKRSAKAAGVLRAAGFRDVQVLRGGMEHWIRNNLPVEGQTATRSA
ncbi:MAG: VTT domain-containing protein [Alphaproteobacteria bacterium]|nr:VTT domain-containing protein [Alphaproteobacteria bacterium]